MALISHLNALMPHLQRDHLNALMPYASSPEPLVPRDEGHLDESLDLDECLVSEIVSTRDV